MTPKQVIEAAEWHESRARSSHAGLSCGSENSEYRAAGKVHEMHMRAVEALRNAAMSEPIYHVAETRMGYVPCEPHMPHAIPLYAAPQPAAIKVKPLEWSDDSEWNIAKTELGRYVVRPCLATNFSGYWLLRRAGAEESDKNLYPSEDTAKSAAQADYEKRVLSALEGGEA